MADFSTVFRGRGFRAYRRAAAAASLGLLVAAAATPVDAASRVAVILAFGDSLTAGYGLPQNEAFPAQLQSRLAREGIKARVVDAGNSGDTTADGLARLDWSLADKPDLVILELGGNDMLRGTEPKIVRANLDAMIKKIKATGAEVLLAGMRSAPNWGARYQAEFDRIYPDLAAANGVKLFPFFLEGVAMDPALNQPDGKHPNARGVAIVVDHIAPYIARLIQNSPNEGPVLGSGPSGGKS
jgi:acyl-CoA thioesterase-1